MGEEIQKTDFEQADYDAFQEKLEQETELLRDVFAKGSFDNQSRVLGYELELCLVDDSGLPSRVNTQVIDATANKAFTTELAQFNMEINGKPFAITRDVLRKVDRDLRNLFAQADAAARERDTRIGLFGVLPSVTREHLKPDDYMTELHRYNQLNNQLLAMRGKPVRLYLEGEETLDVDKNDVMLEALATSLQIHFQVPYDEIVPTYNAGLWSSMLVLPATANSPLVMGKCCWQESRIGIFKQAVDTRNPQEIEDRVVPRVHFGKGYVDSLLDLFEDNFYYSPILPEVLDRPLGDLHHLSLHNGTIWRWVRPIIDRNPDGRYHLRLELRVVPSGPTLIDTVANLAFYLGLTEGLKSYSREEITAVPFATLETDFYRAAREGLKASVHWVDGEEQPVKQILLEHAVPLARRGLERLGIDDDEGWLDIIAERIDSGATGSNWITRHWKRHRDGGKLVCDYLDQAQSDRPVHRWRDPAE